MKLKQGHVEKKLITKAYQTFLMHEGWARASLLQSHLYSKLAPTLLKTETSTSKEVLPRARLHSSEFIIYTHPGVMGELFPLHSFVK